MGRMYPFLLPPGTPGCLTDTKPTGRPAVRPHVDTARPHLALGRETAPRAVRRVPSDGKDEIVQVPLRAGGV